jgi:glycosyltransferase involved in cell wall biosynthesis
MAYLEAKSMTNSMFDLSLVICTRNRASRLSETLKKVSAIQSPLRWELIVADNGSSDQTSAVVEEFAAEFDHSVKFVVETRRGVARAKNAGWQSAKADIIVCIDDDCYPEPDFFDSIYDRFAQDPKLGFMGGRILLYDPTDRRITIQESDESLAFPAGSFIRPGLIQGANVAYRRAALTSVDGFDPWFGAGSLYSGDETELMARISAAGWNGAYDPKPVVYHHHGRKTAADEWRLMRWYDRGRGAYYAKCMLDRGMRGVYVRNWLRTRHEHSWKTTALEIWSGLDYLTRACISGRSFNLKG